MDYLRSFVIKFQSRFFTDPACSSEPFALHLDPGVLQDLSQNPGKTHADCLLGIVSQNIDGSLGIEDNRLFTEGNTQDGCEKLNV